MAWAAAGCRRWRLATTDTDRGGGDYDDDDDDDDDVVVVDDGDDGDDDGDDVWEGAASFELVSQECQAGERCRWSEGTQAGRRRCVSVLIQCVGRDTQRDRDTETERRRRGGDCCVKKRQFQGNFIFLIMN